MKILVVGNGGREHAILEKLRRDAPDGELFITLGNGGTDGLATAIPLKPDEVPALAGWAEENAIDLTVVGPEIPLAEGIVDHFQNRGLRIFGPTRAAAEIESSKAYAKDLMARHNVPTAAFEIFTDEESATAYLEHRDAPIVVKASGLAGGKGAVVCRSRSEALSTVREIFGHGLFGSAGERVVIEEFMKGEELSVFAICDGRRAIILRSAQDHKTIGEGDTGPNTGGMGAYTPVAIATPELMDRIQDEVLTPVIQAMEEEGRPYRGILYAGLMITADGPKVVEFNCRWGDPEAEVILPLMESSLIDLMMTIADGKSLPADVDVRWKAGAAVTTVVASGGYPGSYPTGIPISIPSGLDDEAELHVFHAGTRREQGELLTAGGRVITVTALGPTVAIAAEASREAAEKIRFDGRIFRRDIGWREFARH